MHRLQLLSVFLCCVPLAGSLYCYTCLFPAISPIDCFRFPQECPAGQRCLSSTATGIQGDLQVVMYEKSCAIAAQCGLRGQKYVSGLFFNYTNDCCDTDLCNGAGPVAALGWRGLAFSLLPAVALLLA
ncbi:sperm acrosome membrane-associated protein 4-like [Echeneis naucrates]|uniref:sperm acrosome membrane-associated protein 4-like n=1 Tax=Echeneis naucrates TaxID=173247 RepID=UPI001113C96A|nr:prostate stem cell antigen-like [Echeneis naucrates]